MIRNLLCKGACFPICKQMMLILTSLGCLEDEVIISVTTLCKVSTIQIQGRLKDEKAALVLVLPN